MVPIVTAADSVLAHNAGILKAKINRFLEELEQNACFSRDRFRAF